MFLNRVAIFKVYNSYSEPGKMDSRWLNNACEVTLSARKAGVDVSHVNRNGHIVDASGHVWLVDSTDQWFDSAEDTIDDDYEDQA